MEVAYSYKGRLVRNGHYLDSPGFATVVELSGAPATGYAVHARDILPREKGCLYIFPFDGGDYVCCYVDRTTFISNLVAAKDLDGVKDVYQEVSMISDTDMERMLRAHWKTDKSNAKARKVIKTVVIASSVAVACFLVWLLSGVALLLQDARIANAQEQNRAFYVELGNQMRSKVGSLLQLNSPDIEHTLSGLGADVFSITGYTYKYPIAGGPMVINLEVDTPQVGDGEVTLRKYAAKGGVKIAEIARKGSSLLVKVQP
jgi:hypothetical protein